MTSVTVHPMPPPPRLPPQPPPELSEENLCETELILLAMFEAVLTRQKGRGDPSGALSS